MPGLLALGADEIIEALVHGVDPTARVTRIAAGTWEHHHCSDVAPVGPTEISFLSLTRVCEESQNQTRPILDSRGDPVHLQMIEQQTNDIDGMFKLEEEWRAATEGRRTIRRSVVARFRDDPSRYLVLAFFDDADSAKENSDLPETGEFADRQMALLLGTPKFTDLDVVKQIDY